MHRRTTFGPTFFFVLLLFYLFIFIAFSPVLCVQVAFDAITFNQHTVMIHVLSINIFPGIHRDNLVD